MSSMAEAGAGRSIGTVKWFSEQKGFGFITADDGSDDLFVHRTEIQAEGFRTLCEGQRVEFKVDSRENGRSKAVEVVILGGRRGGGHGGRGRGGGQRGGRFAEGSYGGGGRGGDGDGIECYNCGRIGHLARECYHDGGGGGGYWGYRRRGGGSGGGGGGRSGGGRKCYNCGEEGHFARDCPTVEIEHR